MRFRIITVLALCGLANPWTTRGADIPPPAVTPEEITSLIGRVKLAQPMSWNRIPWTGTVLEAEKASREEKCPVFLFTLDGNIRTGRC